MGSSLKPITPEACLKNLADLSTREKDSDTLWEIDYWLDMYNKLKGRTNGSSRVSADE